MANETALLADLADSFPGGLLGWRLMWTGVVAVLAWALWRYADAGIRRSAQRVATLRKLDEYEARVAVSRTKPMRMTIRVMVLVLATTAVVGVWGLNTAFTGLLATAGFAGIVIGLAAGDIIGDMLAGFLLMWRGPFDIGDWVEIGGVQGIVHDVSLADTTILTFDNEKVTFPNRVVEGNQIRNFTHARSLRLKIPVGVEYGTDLSLARRTLEDVAHSHPRVAEHPQPLAACLAFGDSSVQLDLRVWIDPVRDSALKVRDELIAAIHDRFVHEGIVIAFPHVKVVGIDIPGAPT